MYTHIHTHSHTHAARSTHTHTDAPKFKVEVLNSSFIRLIRLPLQSPLVMKLAPPGQCRRMVYTSHSNRRISL